VTLRAVSLTAGVVGAIGSVALLLRSGHPPFFLVVLFSGWVAFPFAALVVADLLSTTWQARTRVALHTTTPVVAAASLLLYARAVAAMPAARPTPWFVMVPPVSCLVAVLAVAGAAFISRRSSG
jgi:hypothetical protein